MSNLRFAAEKERRVALVTGGARGIGGATAVRIAEEGRDVVIADVLAREGAEMVEKIEALGQQAMFVETDVTDEVCCSGVCGTSGCAFWEIGYSGVLCWYFGMGEAVF